MKQKKSLTIEERNDAFIFWGLVGLIVLLLTFLVGYALNYFPDGI